jgi:hypothetical protein
MFVERDDQRDTFVLSGIGHGLPDDLLMAEMNAVKDTYGEADFLAARLQFAGMVD